MITALAPIVIIWTTLSIFLSISCAKKNYTSFCQFSRYKRLGVSVLLLCLVVCVLNWWLYFGTETCCFAITAVSTAHERDINAEALQSVWNIKRNQYTICICVAVIQLLLNSIKSIALYMHMHKQMINLSYQAISNQLYVLHVSNMIVWVGMYMQMCPRV